MPRKSSEEKERSREQIIQSAADLFREQGIEETTVNQVMERAGMTHGGFYRHFDSKSALVVAAIETAFRAGLDVFDLEENATRGQVKEYLEQYLSQKHVNDPQIGCPMPALSAEISRGDSSWKAELLKGFNTAVTKVQEGSVNYGRKESLAALSLIVGAVTLARAMGDPKVTDELLRAAKYHVTRLS